MKSLIRLMIILSILILFNGLLFYIGWHVWKWLEIVFMIQNPLFFILLFLLLSYSFIIGRLSNYLIIFRTIGYVWFGVIQYSLLLLPIVDLALLLLKVFSIQVSSATYIIMGLIVIVLFFVIISYGLFNAYSPVTRKYEISLPKKKGNRDTLRIAMASDMHFGRLSGVAHAKRLVEKIKEIKPDIILLPGDIIDDEPEPFIQKKMGAILGELQAPLGVFGVLGNHEYYGGQIPEFIEQMKKINISILMDELLTIDGSFQLLGRKDKTDRRRKTFKELILDTDRSYPIIAMDHQPFELKQAQENGVDILLSGHTHRGQMAPNHFITKKMYELDWGYLKKEQLHAFVSSGYGFWGPPFRIGSRSEVMQIDIKFI